MVYLAALLAGQLVAAIVIMALFTITRLLVGKIDRERRNTFDHTALLAYYTVGQSLIGLFLVHGFPRLVG
jgi:cytochrome c oxidase subunit I+III